MTKRRRATAPRGASARSTSAPRSASAHSPWRPKRARISGWLRVILLFVVVLATFGALLAGWSRWSRPSQQGSRIVQIDAPVDRAAVSEALAQKDLVSSSWLMTLYLSTLGRMGDIEPGEHFVPAGASPRELAQCLARSSSRPQVELTIPEGIHHVQVAQRLEQLGICPAAAFVQVVRQRELLDRHGIRGRDGEGYLFPATYRLHVDSQPERLFVRFASETRLRLRRIAAKIGVGPFEALSAARGWGESEILTLASMIEKEARLEQERPLIASVFFNRLDSDSFRPKHMLQSDPTAGYGCLVLRDELPSCRDFQTRVTPAMLRDPSNPYNSYRHPGLPPGPIANPGEPSILAVLQPAKTDYLFFVAARDGSHRFSAAYEEHEARIRNDP